MTIDESSFIFFLPFFFLLLFKKKNVKHKRSCYPMSGTMVPITMSMPQETTRFNVKRHFRAILVNLATVAV